jgi:preprotein translocase subunit Sec63
MQYNYDENGVTFYWFITSVLLIVLVPLTLVPLFTFTKGIKLYIQRTI